jgi:hypothetical protein
MFLRIIYILLFCANFSAAFCQSTNRYWHDKERTLQYKLNNPDSSSPLSFVCENGTRRFNRALYGTNTGFRIETGDLPEFALYMPGMGGNFKLGLISGEKSKWLTAADKIVASWCCDRMSYTIYDSLLQNGRVDVKVSPCPDKDGMIVLVDFTDIPAGVQLAWAFGGATGRRFSRDGDIGADPESSFYLQPEYCKGNEYAVQDSSFLLTYGAGDNRKQMSGVFPGSSSIKIVDPQQQQNPHLLLSSENLATPAIAGHMPVVADEVYFFLVQSGKVEKYDQSSIGDQYRSAGERIKSKLRRVRISGPEQFLNRLGPALSIAADAIYEEPTFLHGAVAWRMRLPAWRGAYAADPLGMFTQARSHFSSYAKSQVTSPDSAAVVMDTALHLARHLEKIGTGMFTSGYICRNPNGDIRPHHYDMNLVFIDQLMNHFNWWGDTPYVKEMWPVIERHLAWEKRNFDADGDGLYDAYCCIWASDALQYSGGGVTHSSAYNYRIFKTAAELAKLIGKDGAAYKKESEKILRAINSELWMPESGWYAEYKDLLGKKLIHPVPGIWTIYHAIDAKLPDPFQAYQATRYVDTEIPHIPVKAKGLKEEGLYVLSTSNWQPYTWSVNNVALAENLHMALAYWQANRPDEAYRLWKSALIESMYLGASPGGFQQLSFYDAVRGQLYRDFADPIGIAARSLAEGLYGFQPDVLHDTLLIRPGYPMEWKETSLSLGDIDYEFERQKEQDYYYISQLYRDSLSIKLQVRAPKTNVSSVTVNDSMVKWTVVQNHMGHPLLQIVTGKDLEHTIKIKWKGDAPAVISCDSVYVAGDSIKLNSGKAIIQSIHDPQLVFNWKKFRGNQLSGTIRPSYGHKTIFVQLKQDIFSWWQPINFKVVNDIEMVSAESTITIKNHSKDTEGQFWVNEFGVDFRLETGSKMNFTMRPIMLVPGTNPVFLQTKNHIATTDVLNWQVSAASETKFEKIDLSKHYNEKVTNIFKQNYLSPRPTSPTLQLPTQGIGNWCYPLTTAEINDSGLRAQAGIKNEIVLPQGIPFSIPGDSTKNNIVFTSQWDNFPDAVAIPLSGKSSHAYMMMAGTTNPMQSRMVNGEVRINYSDGSFKILPLKNPVNWWPIEQDYMNDGYAFTTDGYQPLRYYLKTGKAATTWNDYITIRGFSNRGIDGGAATVLDLPLDINKELKSIVIHSIANDVVIGLMSLTLVR